MNLKLIRHIFISLSVSIPVYWVSLYYIELIIHQEKEELAVAATIGFFVCLYAGRYLSQVWVSYNKEIPNYFLIILGCFIAGIVVWFLVHADFPLQGRPALNILLYWLSFFVLGLALGMLIKFLRINQQYLEEAKTSSAHNKSELQLLQSQLSPHFLFNTLNNLYGISLTRHEKIPPLLLKLSELLRYSVYEAKELFVPLKDEIAYINNYIDFEKIRVGERLIINFSLDQIDPTIKIAPMLLIVFIENAFKHSKNSTDKNIDVDIELKTWANSILFSVKNSYQVNKDTPIQDKYSGLGLDNARKRLDLLYPNRYDLKVDCRDGFYQIMLQLKVK
ncbi:MAG TPA: histidine kinase [Pedobacter sp.]